MTRSTYLYYARDSLFMLRFCKTGKQRAYWLNWAAIWRRRASD